MSNRYTDDQLVFLRDGYIAMEIPELTTVFNKKFGMEKKEGTIRSALKNHGFVCGRNGGFMKGKSKLLTAKQVAFIKYKYQTCDINGLLVLINMHFGLSLKKSQLRAFFKNHKITCGRTGRFEKGNVPWTDGKAGTGICKPNSGCFKKGDIPVNLKTLGSERICPKDGYILIKVAEKNPYTGAPTRYRAKQLVIWEQHNGPIPKGYLVTFIDGDKLNCDIDNLELISLAENLQRNRLGLNKVPDELRPNIRALAKLETVRFKKINEQRK